LGHLLGGFHDLDHEVHEVGDRTVATRCLLPGGRAVAGRFCFGAALRSKGEDSAARRAVGGHQALVFEGGERRVDRPGARPPYSTTALAELGDDLVAVHRLFDQEGEDGGTDVTPAGLGTPAESGAEAAMPAESGAEAVGTPPASAAPSTAARAAEAVSPVGERWAEV
jgi:hypothetical protein